MVKNLILMKNFIKIDRKGRCLELTHDNNLHIKRSEILSNHLDTGAYFRSACRLEIMIHRRRLTPWQPLINRRRRGASVPSGHQCAFGGCLVFSAKY